MTSTHAFIIGIEQIAVGFAIGLVSGLMLEQELFKEPRSMGQVPFARTGEYSRLYRQIGFTQRLGKLQGTLADVLEALAKLLFV